MDCAASNEQDGVMTPSAAKRCRHPAHAAGGANTTVAGGSADAASDSPRDAEAASAAHKGVTLRVPPFYVLHGPARLGRSAKLN